MYRIHHGVDVSVINIYHSMSQAVKAVMHYQHLVALEDPDPDS